MTTPTESELAELARSADELRGELRRFAGSRSSASGNKIEFAVNAGGVGVWISTCCCAVMLGISIIGASVIIDQGRRISDLNDYLAAIYMQAPHLKPKEPEE